MVFKSILEIVSSHSFKRTGRARRQGRADQTPGWGGIRTHGELAPTLVFKTSALNRSATHPGQANLTTAGSQFKLDWAWCRNMQGRGRKETGSVTDMTAEQGKRPRGFAERSSLERATGWIDAHARGLAAEDVSLDDATGRILAVDVAAAIDVPPFDRAST